MVDIDPTASVNHYTPRNATLVDAVADTKRVADQLMRSNPLKNANIGSGLTQWLGNYSLDFAAFGEFFPADPTLFDDFGNPLPQRGTSLTRDDPQGNPAFQIYDYDPAPGGPLRQKLLMFDADRRIMLRESMHGGRAFPDKAIPLYPNYTYIDANGLTYTSATIVWRGEGNIIGSHVNFQGQWSANGSPTISSFLRVIGNSGTVNSSTEVIAGASFVTHVVDLRGPVFDGDDYVDVQWFVWRSGGTGAFWPRPTRCRNFSDD